jgi:threonine synthase
MSYVRCLRGLASGIEYPADVPMNLDPADGRPAEMVLETRRVAGDRPHDVMFRHNEGLWESSAGCYLRVRAGTK